MVEELEKQAVLAVARLVSLVIWKTVTTDTLGSHSTSVGEGLQLSDLVRAYV